MEAYVRMYMGVCSIRMVRLKELSSVANTNENSIICTVEEYYVCALLMAESSWVND